MVKVVVGVVVVSLALTGCVAAPQSKQAAPEATAVQETRAVASGGRMAAKVVRPGVIHVQITNTGKRQLPVNPLFFKGLDTAKEEFQSKVTGEMEEIKTSAISPGVRISGNVYFNTTHKLTKISLTDVGGEALVSASVT
ncbi:DUF4352 domain-containing protein [Actinomadura oligospora]|uniref:DUF4352 domain-containing protein n=1 Tax=Actinomadura oligospora TaxID=111804 RepID=UPI00047E8B4C|nr:DUF4352 domain-containing protein [Actinomadura oligospora]